MLKRIWQLLEEVFGKRPFVAGPITIPGIGTGSAYADGDAFGTPFELEVPVRGTIITLVYYDLDDEGLAMDVPVFSTPITGTADNGVFAPTDTELRSCLGVIPISAADFNNWSSNQIATVRNVGFSYVSPSGKITIQMVARGTPNIAAGNLPRLMLVIL